MGTIKPLIRPTPKPLHRRLLIALGWLVHHLAPGIKWVVRAFCKILFWHPLGKMLPAGKKAGFWWFKRLVGELAYRLALLPLLGAVVWVATIYAVTHPPRQAVATTPEQYSLICKDVQFTTDDGVTLKGWYVNSLAANHPRTDESWRELRPAVVMCHGYRGTRDQLLHPLGIQLAKAGYDLLLIDMRGHGLSDDAPVSFGTTEAADVIAAVRFLQDQPGVDDDRIGVLGSGMGGYAAILAGPRCKGVQCVVAMDTYPSVPLVFRRVAEQMHMPGELGTAFTWGMSAYFGHRLIDDNAADAARNFTDRGLLLVSGSADDRVRSEDLDPVITAASSNAARLVVPGARAGEAASNPAAARIILQYIDGMLVQRGHHARVVATLPPHL